MNAELNLNIGIMDQTHSFASYGFGRIQLMAKAADSILAPVLSNSAAHRICENSTVASLYVKVAKVVLPATILPIVPIQESISYAESMG